MARTSRTARDLGLQQVSATTKWIAAGAAVLTGIFAVWEARTARTVGASTPRVPGRSAPSPVPGLRDPATDPGYPDPYSDRYSDPYADPSYSDPYSEPGLQPPARPPARSYLPPIASSGGS